MAAINVVVRATGGVPSRVVLCEYALPHQNVTLVAQGESNTVRVDIAPDHEEPSSMLAANNNLGKQRARANPQPSF